jgi:hypothetical protein
MSPHKLLSRLVNTANRWVPRSMLILSLVALLGCAIILVTLVVVGTQAKAVAGQGLAGLGSGFLMMVLMFYLVIVGSVGSILALVGLIYEMVARRRFHRLLAILLSLNVLAGPIPLLYSWVSLQIRLNPPLLRAVKSGDLQRVQSILSSYKTAPEPGTGGASALGAAVEANRMDMIDALVSAYTRWHQNVVADVSYDWALTLACERNNIDLAKQLLQAGADPNIYHGYGRLPANVAVRNANRQLLQLLLDAGAKPIMGYPEPDPLREAVAKGNAEYVQLLLSYDTDKIMKRELGYGSYLLSVVPPRSESVTRLLLDAGADPRLGPPDTTHTHCFK